MYGINNNTGTLYSQHENSHTNFARGINSTNPGNKIKTAMSIFNDLENIKNSNTGGERLKSIAKIAAKIAGGM